MAGTTSDLTKGTSKAVYHVPGYAGHIPAEQPLGRVSRAEAHGSGEHTRKQYSLIRKYYRHNMPGYVEGA